ncbi:hypothetical protein [Bacillus sp. Marseille-P3661]|uniref:hypothetical protein n=1 Tax=Bacillus sp. Marseille-P3661 TaxID=1936234 RepID=UPI000C85E6A2|nr:hypothetical protein [Bacillus sp. Marseille-P3661]
MARTKTSAGHHEAQQKQARHLKTPETEIAEEFVTDVKEEDQVVKKQKKHGRKRSSEPKNAKSHFVKGPR